jgi:hypothetical protein
MGTEQKDERKPRSRWVKPSQQACPQCGTKGHLWDGRRGDDVYGWCEAPGCKFEY